METDKMTHEKEIDQTLDDVLISIGELGKYQIRTFILYILAVILHSSIHNAFVFTALDINHRCAIPECETNVTTFEPPWLPSAVPYNNKYPQKCKRFVYTGKAGTCNAEDFDITQEITCSSYVYQTQEWSILQEYDLHCEENLWKLTMVGTVNGVGQFVGLFIGGVISDKYGRKFLLIWGMVTCAFFGIIKTVMPTYELFLIFEFLDATFGIGTYISGYIVAVELVGPKKRAVTGILASSCYPVGEILTAAAAWYFQSWKPISYILYAPSFLLISYIWIVPESVRWLLSKGRTEEAKAILREAAKCNDKDICEQTLEKLATQKEKNLKEDKGQLLQAIKSLTICVRLILCSFCWIVCAFHFYGLTLNSVSLVSGNSYLNFILTALIEVPGYVFSRYTLDLFGRKISLCCSFIITGLACASFILVPEDSYAGSLTIYLLGKFGSTVGFTVLYIHTSEMFPTKMRHTFMGACSMLGRVGSIVAPQTPLLEQIWNPLPFIIFAILAGLAAASTMFFPETSNIKLPDTVEEAENISK